jgi:energy-coupling factor transport system permease protein
LALDISLGQYYEGASPIHKMDPRAKLIAAILYIVAIFLAKNIFSFVLLVVFTAIATVISGVPARTILRGLKPIIIIMIFTAVLNLFWTSGETPLVDWKFIKIYEEGLWTAVFMVIRIVVLLAGTSVILTYTTTPIALTDGLERLLDPLKKIKLPVHEFSLMMTIALRFIPTLTEETQKIMNAQKARGADFTQGKLTERAKALIPVLVPLFVSAFRRADELATAMECRCYRGGEGRTRMNIMRLHASDYFATSLFAVLIAVIILLNRYAPGYTLGW